MTNFTMLVRNRPRLTKQALESFSHTRAGGVYTLVVDDRSDDETKHIVEDAWAANAIDGIWRNDKARGTGPLRNLSVEVSQRRWGRGDYLCLSDNDCFFTSGWLETLIECYEESAKYGFKIIGAYNHPFMHPIPNEQRVKVGDHEVYPVYALATQSMLMTWDVWDAFGPFCDTPVDKVCQSEDVAFSNKIREAGGRIGVVSPHLVYGTGITNTFGEKIPGWELVKSQCPEGVLCQ